jgi:hypothetical protein
MQYVGDSTDGFCSKFARAYCAVEPSEFWGMGVAKSRKKYCTIKADCGDDARATKRQTTNNHATLRDLII